MKKVTLIILLLIISFIVLPSTENDAIARDGRYIDYSKQVIAYGDLHIPRHMKINITEFVDSEGCKYIITQREGSPAISMQEKSNSPCRKSTDTNKLDELKVKDK